MTVEPAHPDRMLRSAVVDPLFSRQLASPELVVPVPVPDPSAGGFGARESGDAIGELRWRRGFAQLHRRQPETTRKKVNMRIDESRNHKCAARVDDGRVVARTLHHFGAR